MHCGQINSLQLLPAICVYAYKGTPQHIYIRHSVNSITELELRNFELELKLRNLELELRNLEFEVSYKTIKSKN